MTNITKHLDILTLAPHDDMDCLGELPLLIVDLREDFPIYHPYQDLIL